MHACIVVVMIKSDVQQGVPTNRRLALCSSFHFQMLTVSATQATPCILWNLDDHHCVQNPPAGPYPET